MSDLSAIDGAHQYRKRGAFLLWLPAIAFVLYQLLILWIVFYGPLYWPIENPGSVVVFYAVMLSMTVFGYTLGIMGHSRQGKAKHLDRWFHIGSIATIILFVPSLYIYTGKGLGDLVAAVQSQGQAYDEYQDFLAQGGSLAYFVLLRGFLAPFTLTVVPLLFLRWKSITIQWRAIGILALLCIIAFSVARGTDKETIETTLFIVIGFAGTMLMQPPGKFRIRRHLPKILFGVVVVVAAFSVFATRKNERLGDLVNYCQTVTRECADYDHFVLRNIPESLEMPVNLVFNYFGQGTYGLSLALQKDFRSTYGLGHSSFLLSQAERLGGDGFAGRSYTYRLDSENDWPRKNAWSTAYVWIANDIGFGGVYAFMMLFGFFLAKAWKDFVCLGNLHAYLVLVVFAIFTFYAPMNMQLTLTVDYYLTTVAWLSFWWFGRRSVHSLAAGGRLATSNKT